MLTLASHTLLVLTLTAPSPSATPAPADAPAQAGKVRYKRHKKPRVRAKTTLKTKVSKAQKKAAGQLAKPTAKRPPLRTTARDMTVIDAQIVLVKKLLAATQKDDPEYADLLFRLADLYLDKKAYYEMQSAALYEPIYEAEQAAQKK